MLEQEFWRESRKMSELEFGDGWVLTWTLAVILLIIICSLLSQPPSHLLAPLLSPAIITDLDLKNLIDNLDDNSHSLDNVNWETACDKRNNHLSYKAKFYKPKDVPLKYLSVTTFENCSVELLVKFYVDNCYRMLWDKTAVRHESLQVDQGSGTEIGRTIKKFPFLTPREYVLAWRLWKGKDGSFDCISKVIIISWSTVVDQSILWLLYYIATTVMIVRVPTIHTIHEHILANSFGGLKTTHVVNELMCS